MRIARNTSTTEAHFLAGVFLNGGNALFRRLTVGCNEPIHSPSYIDIQPASSSVRSVTMARKSSETLCSRILRFFVHLTRTCRRVLAGRGYTSRWRFIWLVCFFAGWKSRRLSRLILNVVVSTLFLEFRDGISLRIRLSHFVRLVKGGSLNRLFGKTPVDFAVSGIIRGYTRIE